MFKNQNMLVAVIGLCFFALLHLGMTSVSTSAQEAQGNAHKGSFQISAWSRAASPGLASMNGAYIINTETGMVWAIINDNAPREIGSVKK